MKPIFSKRKTFLKTFSIESTRIENATIPYKTALSEANVKTYHKSKK